MRFYAVDPQEEISSPYVYCANNPIKFVDPTGEETFEKLEPNYTNLNEGEYYWVKEFNKEERKYKLLGYILDENGNPLEGDGSKSFKLETKWSNDWYIDGGPNKMMDETYKNMGEAVEALDEFAQYSKDIDKELYNKIIENEDGTVNMTVPIVRPFKNRVVSSKINYNDEINKKSNGYWHSHGDVKKRYATEKMSNPEDYDKKLKYSLLTTPSKIKQRAINKGNGKFQLEIYNQNTKKWNFSKNVQSRW